MRMSDIERAHHLKRTLEAIEDIEERLKTRDRAEFYLSMHFQAKAPLFGTTERNLLITRERFVGILPLIKEDILSQLQAMGIRRD